MAKRKHSSKKSARLEQLLEDHKRYVENEPFRRRQIEEAKREIDLQLWEYPLPFTINGAFGRLVCLYDQTQTIEFAIDTLEILDRYKDKIDRSSYSSRMSLLINFIFWRKMQDFLQELAWEVSEMIMHEDIFDGFSAYEAISKRQRIPPRFLNTSKHIADELRKDRWTATIGKGMRGKDHGRRKRRHITAPAHETNRLNILSAIKSIRAMSEEKQDEILNNKKKLAHEAGISYHTLRRSEIQGGWTTEDLIVEFTAGKVRRAPKK
jgi:hypothetical protein